MFKFNIIEVANVPTNIITGFLGVGKTSTILHLLKNKPGEENWAVLVNEFGEIGVDGGLFKSKHSSNQGVFIQEVPGGCMCCASGLPMQLALNTLLAQAQPNRLLIEPTGLGHPVEILEELSGDNYRDLLALEKVVTLVDARNLANEKLANNATFKQQIAIADIIIGNKSDLYEDADKESLEQYIAQLDISEPPAILFTSHGQIDISLLEGSPRLTYKQRQTHIGLQEKTAILNESPIPECGYIRAENQGEGFKSIGWRFNPYQVFNRSKLFAFLSGLQVERMKGVFITENGVFGYNLSSNTLSELELNDCLESRVEIISEQIENGWEKELLDCIT